MTHTALGLVVLILAAHVALLVVAYGIARLVAWYARRLTETSTTTGGTR